MSFFDFGIEKWAYISTANTFLYLIFRDSSDFLKFRHMYTSNSNIECLEKAVCISLINEFWSKNNAENKNQIYFIVSHIIILKLVQPCNYRSAQLMYMICGYPFMLVHNCIKGFYWFCYSITMLHIQKLCKNGFIGYTNSVLPLYYAAHLNHWIWKSVQIETESEFMQNCCSLHAHSIRVSFLIKRNAL